MDDLHAGKIGNLGRRVRIDRIPGLPHSDEPGRNLFLARRRNLLNVIYSSRFGLVIALLLAVVMAEALFKSYRIVDGQPVTTVVVNKSTVKS